MCGSPCFDFYNMLWAPNTYMFYVIPMMYLLYDDDGLPHVVFMVVFCGTHVINDNLECYLQWYIHSYFGL